MNRNEFITSGAAVLALSNCERRGLVDAPVRVGSKDFPEDLIVAEIYCQVLERVDLPVKRIFGLGDVHVTTTALVEGVIDLYPEYTGTGLIEVLHCDPTNDRCQILHRLRQAYAKCNIDWLTPSPSNDSQALVTTPQLAGRIGCTLSAFSMCAQELTLAIIPEFGHRRDGLPLLRKRYGGFEFKDTLTREPSRQYEALLLGLADVASGSTTDPQISSFGLVPLKDDLCAWPPYSVTPVIRMSAKRPKLVPTLDAVSRELNDVTLTNLNDAVSVEKIDPRTAAGDFVRAISGIGRQRRPGPYC